MTRERGRTAFMRKQREQADAAPMPTGTVTLGAHP